MADFSERGTDRATDDTRIGSVFVSNYPPYSFWRPDRVDDVRRLLDSPPVPGTPFGLYMHIPFCRRRCKFCYFRVYTDKNSSDVERYVEGLSREIELAGELPAIRGRKPRFVYFGGGTPSFISGKHLRRLVERVRQVIDWDEAEEVTFECEPGTLTEAKLDTIREIGVTRLSLGVENFDDGILSENGRAHLSEEIYRVLPWIEARGFDQVNVDLIAGMVGETWDTWRDTVRKTVDVSPDSVTVYQMELPFNTVYSREALDGGPTIPVADWNTKRAWQEYAFRRLEDAGYEISSAYTMVKKGRPCRFVYRDSVWHGCDMLGTGVASFSHVSGAHFQNESSWEPYLGRVEAGELPLERAFVTSPHERLTRELILQLKLGEVPVDYFREKFGVDILEEFREAFDGLHAEQVLEVRDGRVKVAPQALLLVDFVLPRFYAPEYRNARYT